MGSKVFSIITIVAMGWVLTDLLLHPSGVSQLGTTTNSLLTTAGNSVEGISTNTNAKLVGG